MGSAGKLARGVSLTEAVFAALLAEAACHHPLEACGLLLGQRGDEGEIITAIHPAANVAPDPARHFEIDPATLIAAHKTERAGGTQLLGWYHSHPSGPATPSLADRADAPGDGRIWAIIGRAETGEPAIRFWRDTPEGFVSLGARVTAR